MMLNIVIHGTDVTKYTVTQSLTVELNDNYRNTATLVLQYTRLDFEVAFGHEIIISHGDQRIFGGVILSVRTIWEHWDDQFLIIECNSYDHVLTRRTTNVAWDGYAGDMIVHYLERWLGETSQYDEGFVAGDIEPGVHVNAVTNVISFSDLFDHVASASGFIWYVDNYKRLHFKPWYKGEVTDATIDADDRFNRDSNNIGMYQLEVVQGDEQFATRVFAVGSNGVYGEDINLSAEARMAQRGGSGVWGKIIHNSSITEKDEAQQAAAAEALKYSAIPQKVTFKCTRFFKPLQSVRIKAASRGIPNSMLFTVTKTVIMQVGTELQYQYEAEASDSSGLTRGTSAVHYGKDDWVRIWKRFKRTNDTSDGSLRDNLLFVQQLPETLNSNSIYVVTGEEDTEAVPNDYIKEMTELHQANNEVFYDHIPPDIAEQHADAIVEVDNFLLNSEDGKTLVSNSDKFNLVLYNKHIQLGVLYEMPKTDVRFEKIYALSKAISRRTIIKEVTPNIATMVDLVRWPPGQNAQRSTRAKQVDAMVESQPRIVAKNYDVQGAIDYAYKWTVRGKVTRNPKYNFFDEKDDCTNFISQCLYEGGGIEQVNKWYVVKNRSRDENWYYLNFLLLLPSYTWGGAHNLYRHFELSENVRRIYKLSELQLGDVVQWDIFPEDGEWHIDHSTIVTKIEDGEVYLTYHMQDKDDEPMQNLLDKGYRSYAWAINH